MSGMLKNVKLSFKPTVVQEWVLLGFGVFMTVKCGIMFGVFIDPWVFVNKMLYSIGAHLPSIVQLTGGAIALSSGFIVYQQMPRTKSRKKLIKVFDEIGAYIEKGNRRVYPSIYHIAYAADRIEMVFSISYQIKPDLIAGNEWIFKNMFGQHTEIKREGKKFTVNAYFEPIKAFDYDYNEIQPLLAKHKFPIYAGKSREGHVVYDATGNANGLIAGINGSGKSAFLRTMICTWVQFFTPAQIEIHLCDLKKSEFGIYRKVKHVRSVSNTKEELEQVVKEIKKELDKRCEILDESGENHINDVRGVQLPIVALIIDEVAVLDLKHKDSKELAHQLNLICALGRAVNIQTYFSMQRPDAEQIDSKVKANMNVRFVFRQNSTINSSVALDSDEAAKIPVEQKGLMAFSYDGIQYVQAAWLSGDRAKNIVKAVVEKYGENEIQKVIAVQNGEIVEEETDSLTDFNVFGGSLN